LRSIFSLKSLFEPEHFKGSQQKKFQLESSLCELLFCKKASHPMKSRGKFEFRNDIICNQFVLKKYSTDVQRILFENFTKYFLKNMKANAKNSFGGGNHRP